MTKARTLANFDSSGVLTSTSSLDATKLTGALPALNGSALTGLADNGITEADQFRLVADFTDDNQFIGMSAASALERVDTGGFNKIGTGMTNASGVFSYPSTGVYLIQFEAFIHADAVAATALMKIRTSTTSANSFSDVNQKEVYVSIGNKVAASIQCIINVTDLTNQKCAFGITQLATTTIVKGDSNITETGMTFIRLGDST